MNSRADGGDFDEEDRYEELRRLFHLMDETPPPQRAAVLERECPDPALRRNVWALLESAAAAKESMARELPEGICIGPYRLLRSLGSGRMGIVYLAERLVDGTASRAALKILAPQAVDDVFLDEFAREQRQLAALDHPHIVKMLDAGWTEAGQAYLVAEYVDGMHLDAFCDSHRLGVAQRLALFLQVCDAVDHAHRNLIVHLDLKPANILVTADGVAKLLDFGTAKLIRPDAEAGTGHLTTLAYVSPEQVLHEAVSTGSDVYGLGAILYQLLSGRVPFRRSSAAARLEGAARLAEPEPVTNAVTAQAAADRGLTEQALRQALSGDLTAVTAACLRPRPRDRYAGVAALADEIRRYLRLEPVLVRPQTLAYRAEKLLRRRRRPLAIAAAATVALLLALGLAWSQQQRAVRDAGRAVRMQAFMSGLFRLANPSVTGKPVTSVPELLRVGLAKLPGTLPDPADLRAAQLSLAESLDASGDLAGARAAFASVIASAARAGASADQAEAEAFAGDIEFRQGHLPQSRALAAHALKLSRLRGVPDRVHVLAAVFYAMNEDKAGFRTDETLGLLRAAFRESVDAHLDPAVSAFALKSLANDLDSRGEIEEARVAFERLLALYGSDPLAVCDRSETLSWLAWLDDQSGEAAASLPLFRRAYEGYVECSGADSRDALDQLPYWADALIKTGQAAEAVRMLQESLPAWRRVEGHDPTMSGYLFFLGRGYIAGGRYVEAEHVGQELLELVTGTLGTDNRGTGMAHLLLGQALLGQRRLAAAAPHAWLAENLLARDVVSSYGRMLLAEARKLARAVGEGP